METKEIFYSIEQKVYFPQGPNVEAHISLAYRVGGEPFEIRDLLQITARSLDLKNYRVRKKNLKLKLRIVLIGILVNGIS